MSAQMLLRLSDNACLLDATSATFQEALQSVQHLPLGLQGGDVAPARLHRTGGLGVRMENGGRSLPDGVPSHQDRPEKIEREAYDAGPQNSNGTTMGQVLTAGPQSAQPEGAQTEPGMNFQGCPRLVAGGHVALESRAA